MLSGEIVSPTRILFQYTNELSKSDKIRSFIAPSMTYLITFLDNNEKYAVYTGGYINGIYRYLAMIGDPTALTTSGQRYHHLSPSCYSNNYAATLKPVSIDLLMRQKLICECCGRIGHKADTWIIRGPKFLPTSLRRKSNQFNALHGDEPNKPPKECNSQPLSSHFKSSTYSSKTNPVTSYIMGRINHHDIYNGDVKIPTSDFPVECHYE